MNPIQYLILQLARIPISLLLVIIIIVAGIVAMCVTAMIGVSAGMPRLQEIHYISPEGKIITIPPTWKRVITE